MLTPEQIDVWRKLIQDRFNHPQNHAEIDALCDMALASLEAAPSSCPVCRTWTAGGVCLSCYEAGHRDQAAPSGEALDLHELREAAGEAGNGVCPHAYALCPHCQPPASQGVDLMTAWLQGYESGVHDAEHPTLQPAFNPYEDKAAPAPSVNKGE